MRLFFHLSYKGNLYKGWQKQKNTTGCVQEVIENALLTATKHTINLVGCGRTDAGVHASRFYAHAEVSEELAAILHNRFDIINYCLPKDIRLHDLFPSDHHARLSAYSRLYRYKMHFTPNVFLNELSAYYPFLDLDVEAINAGCEIVVQQSDFYNFCKTPDKHPSTLCKVRHCTFIYDPILHQAELVIEANRFLKSMVRIIVWRLLEVGQGNLTISEFEKMFDRSTSHNVQKLALPHGLYLEDIKYNNRTQNKIESDPPQSDS